MPSDICRAARTLCALAVGATLCCVFALRARAENRQPLFLSDDAAMMGGAVVASTGQAGAAWYNPAGLGAVHRSSVDVSASAFVLRAYQVPGIVQASGDGVAAEASLDEIEIQSVPTALVAARVLTDDVVGALGVFVPISIRRDTSTDVTVGDTAATRRAHLAFHLDQNEYHFGAAVGWKVTPTLRLGAALMGVYESVDRSLDYWAGAEPGASAAGPALAREVRQEAERGGLHLSLGLQWDVTESWHLGLFVRTPTFHVYTGFDDSTNFVRAGSGGDEGYRRRTARDESWGFSDGTPVQIVAGVAWRTGRGCLALEGELRTPHEPHDANGRSARLLWNARLGGQLQVSDRVTLGAGLFTDNTDAPSPEAVGQTAIDYYGVSAAVELRTRRKLDQDGGGGDSLVFATTIGLRYAFGIGEVGGIGLTMDGATGEIGERPLAQEITAHNFTVHVGSAAFF